jgi:hypothetical protein
MVMWSPGWLFSKDATRFWTAVLAGLGPVVTSHIVTVVPLPLALLAFDAALPLPAADPQAASTIAAAAATAAVTGTRQPRLAARLAERPGMSAIVSSRSPWASWPEFFSETFRKHFERV